MDYTELFPKRGAALAAEGSHGYVKSVVILDDEATFQKLWDDNVSSVDHGDTLNLIDTTLEPTLAQLESLLKDIGHRLKTLQLSAVFSRIAKEEKCMSRLLWMITRYCGKGKLEKLTVSKFFDGSSPIDSEILEQMALATDFTSSLRYLDFSSISFKESVPFRKFISKCRRLETLKLCDSTFRFCGGWPIPIPLTVDMPNLKELHLDRLVGCLDDSFLCIHEDRFKWENAYGKHESKPLNYPRPCESCDPNRRRYEKIQYEEEQNWWEDEEEEWEEDKKCCHSADITKMTLRINAARYKVRYQYHSVMMKRLPNLEFLDISDISVWEHIKKYLTESGKRLETVRFVNQDERSRYEEFKRGYYDRNEYHYPSCSVMATYHDYRFDDFWSTFPADTIIRDGSFDETLERLRKYQEPGIRTPVTVNHIDWHMLNSKGENKLKKLFVTVRETWRKYSYDLHIHTLFVNILMNISRTYGKDVLISEGLTAAMFDSAIEEVVEDPVGKRLTLLPLLACFDALEFNNDDGLTGETLMKLFAAMDESDADKSETMEQERQDMRKRLQRKYKIKEPKKSVGDREKNITKRRKLSIKGAFQNV